MTTSASAEFKLKVCRLITRIDRQEQQTGHGFDKIWRGEPNFVTWNKKMGGVESRCAAVLLDRQYEQSVADVADQDIAGRQVRVNAPRPVENNGIAVG